ncbi:uncharacterized protein BKA55DRAFT_691317 [Fusarium redolens]|uniref:Uncharacterized protein n=1 Tax=Fusarium redolens TaxID=48865 RepID=A0A9P9GYZ2_FUSRE|nr:uncharacterized protein BKA55DRAFT_691317 [Fusarium redolens]KAH7247280.1 hypothetical protein BKA55DRAFT_691317 [Fusarium redolens]
MAWDDFLRAMNDSKYPNLTFANPDKIHPHIAPLDDPSAHSEAQNQVRYADMIASIRTRTSTLETLPGCREAVQALEKMRKVLTYMISECLRQASVSTNIDPQDVNRHKNTTNL